MAQIQFISIDNTHTKYLHGTDKKAWNNYKDAYEAQVKLDNFVANMKVPKLKEGEEFEIPVNKNKKKNKEHGK